MRRFALWSFALLAIVPAARTRSQSTDAGFEHLLRALVVDSVPHERRARPGAIFASGSTETTRWLTRFQVRRPPVASEGERPSCPGSTDVHPLSPTGYLVRIRVIVGTGGRRRVTVVKSCNATGGDPRSRGFFQDLTWDVRLISGKWRVMRLLTGTVT